MVAEYLGEFKNESLLKAKAEELGLDPKADMYKMHAYVGGKNSEEIIKDGPPCFFIYSFFCH